MGRPGPDRCHEWWRVRGGLRGNADGAGHDFACRGSCWHSIHKSQPALIDYLQLHFPLCFPLLLATSGCFVDNRSVGGRERICVAEMQEIYWEASRRFLSGCFVQIIDQSRMQMLDALRLACESACPSVIAAVWVDAPLAGSACQRAVDAARHQNTHSRAAQRRPVAP